MDKLNESEYIEELTGRDSSPDLVEDAVIDWEIIDESSLADKVDQQSAIKTGSNLEEPVVESFSDVTSCPVIVVNNAAVTNHSR